MTLEQQKNFLTKSAFYTVATALTLLALKLLTGVLFPFAAALFITVCLQGIINRLVNKFRIKRKPASVLTVAVLFFVLGLLLFWLFRVLYRQLLDLINALPSYSEQITSVLDTLTEKFKELFGKVPILGGGMLDEMPSAALSTVTEKLTAWLTAAVTDLAAAVPKFVFSLLVMIIASIYFAKDFEDIKQFIKNTVDRRHLKKLKNIKEILMTKTAKLIKGYLIIIVMTFVELSLGLMLLKVKYALIIAAVTALIDILPVLGSGTVLIPWAVISAISGNSALSIGLIVLYLVITAVRNIFEPKIIGSEIGLHPLVMLASVFLGLKLFGAAGVIAAPLIAVTLKSVYDSRVIDPAQSKDPDT